jgi:hypothetical protein
MAGLITKEVEEKIFSELDKIKKEEVVTNVNLEQKETQTLKKVEPKQETPIKPQNNIGTSFEQIILNQTKAMMPAVASSELGYGVAKPAPANLPTADSVQNFVETKEKQSNFAEATLDKKAIHNYIGTNDPYREPI